MKPSTYFKTRFKKMPFFIAIAVPCLFIFLGYKVTQFNYLEGSIPAQDILSYGKDIKQAVEILKSEHGCSPKQLSFEHAADMAYLNANSPKNKKCHLFDKAGGNMVLKTQFREYELDTPPLFSAYFQILNQNTPQSKWPLYKFNDVVMYITVNEKICRHINEHLGIEEYGFALESDIPTGKFNGDFKINIAAAPDDGETFKGTQQAFINKTNQMGCWKQRKEENYIFYVTLASR